MPVLVTVTWTGCTSLAQAAFICSGFHPFRYAGRVTWRRTGADDEVPGPMVTEAVRVLVVVVVWRSVTLVVMVSVSATRVEVTSVVVVVIAVLVESGGGFAVRVIFDVTPQPPFGQTVVVFDVVFVVVLVVYFVEVDGLGRSLGQYALQRSCPLCARRMETRRFMSEYSGRVILSDCVE